MAAPTIGFVPGEFHFVFKNDPREFLSLLNNYVKLETNFKSQHTGYVYTVDPVTGSYVLVQPNEDNTNVGKVEVVLGHTVKHVTVEHEQHSKPVADMLVLKMDALCNKTSDGSMGPEEIVRKRGQIIAWLRMNLIPIKQDSEDPNTLTLMNSVQIVPPYNADDCYSDNEVILEKMQGLLSAMPNVLDDDDV